MLGEDFYCIIQHDSRLSINFKGVYAANELPSQLPVRGLAIVNCCNRNKPGKHWIALCQESESTLEMFDSFGFGPEMYNLENKLPKSEIIKYNSKTTTTSYFRSLWILLLVLLLFQVSWTFNGGDCICKLFKRYSKQ